MKRLFSLELLWFCGVAAAVLCSAPSPSHAQAVVGQLQQFGLPSPFVDDWERNPYIGVTIRNTTDETQQCYIRLDFRSTTNYTFNSTSKMITLAPRQQLVIDNTTLSGYKLIDWRETAQTRDPQLRAVAMDVLFSGIIPEGIYTICGVILNAARQEIARLDPCANLDVTFPEQPMFILPDATVDANAPGFLIQWTQTGSPLIQQRLRYKLRMCERLPNQSAEQALLSNRPILDDVLLTQCQYRYITGQDLPLIPYSSYALRVTEGVIDPNGLFSPFGQAGGQSPIHVFTWGLPLADITITRPDEAAVVLLPPIGIDLQWTHPGILPPGLQFRVTWAPWDGQSPAKQVLDGATARSLAVARELRAATIPNANLVSGRTLLRVSITRTSDNRVLAMSDPVSIIVYTGTSSILTTTPVENGTLTTPVIPFSWQRSTIEFANLYRLTVARITAGRTPTQALEAGPIVHTKAFTAQGSECAEPARFCQNLTIADLGMTERDFLEGVNNSFAWRVTLETPNAPVQVATSTVKRFTTHDPLRPMLQLTTLVWDSANGTTARDIPVDLQPVDGPGPMARALGAPIRMITNSNGIATWQFPRDSVDWAYCRFVIPADGMRATTTSRIVNWQSEGREQRVRLEWRGTPINAYRTVTIVSQVAMPLRLIPVDHLAVLVAVRDARTNAVLPNTNVEVAFFDPVAGQAGVSFSNQAYRNASIRLVTSNAGIAYIVLRRAQMPSRHIGITVTRDHYYEKSSAVLHMDTFLRQMTDSGVTASNLFALQIEENAVRGTVVEKSYNTPVANANVHAYSVRRTPREAQVRPGVTKTIWDSDTTDHGRVTTDANGRFVFPDLPDSVDIFLTGSYLNFQEEVYMEPGTGPVMHKLGAINDYRIELTGNDTRLEGSIAASDQLWNEPVAHVRVSVWKRIICQGFANPYGGRAPDRPIYAWVGDAETDDNGNYRLDRVPVDLRLFVTVNWNEWRSSASEDRGDEFCEAGHDSYPGFTYKVNDPMFKAWQPIRWVGGQQPNPGQTGTLQWGEDPETASRYDLGYAQVGVTLRPGVRRMLLVKQSADIIVRDEFTLRTIPDARVEIFNDTLRPPKIVLTSDAEGRCNGVQLPFGRRYWVRVSAAAYDSKRVRTAAMTQDRVITVDLHQQKATVRGRVRNSVTLSPVGGARVQLLDAATRQLVAGNAGEYSVLATNDSGSYILGQRRVNGNAISIIHPGSYIVQTTASGFVTSEVHVTLAAGEQRIVDVALEAHAGDVEGTVTSSNQPVAGAIVSVDGRNSTTDQRGFYRITDVRVGTPWMECSAPGFLTNQGSVTVRNGQTTTRNISLDEERYTIGVVVFRDNTSTLLPGATVRVEGVPAVVTDAGGLALIAGVPAGVVNITVEPPAGQMLTTSRITSTLPRPGNLNLFSTTLRQAGTYTLTITNATSGQPIPNADVTVENGPEYSQRANAQGIATLRLPTGRWNLRVTASGYLAGFAANVQVQAGQSTQGTMRLTPSGLPADLFHGFPYTIDSLRNTATGIIVSGLLRLPLPNGTCLKLPAGLASIDARFANIEIRNDRLLNAEVQVQFPEITGLTLHGFSATIRGARVTLTAQGLEVPLRINLEPLQAVVPGSDLSNIDCSVRVSTTGVQLAGNASLSFSVPNIRQTISGIVLAVGNTIGLSVDGLAFNGNLQLPFPNVRDIAFRNFRISKVGRISMDAIALAAPGVSFTSSILSVRLDSVRMDTRGFALSGTLSITGVPAVELDSIKVFGLRLGGGGSIASIDGYRIFGGFRLAGYRVPNNQSLSVQIGADDARRLYIALRGDLPLPGLDGSIRLDPLIVKSDGSIEGSIPVNESRSFNNVLSVALQRIDIRSTEIVLVGGINFSIPGLTVQVGNFHFGRNSSVSVDSIRVAFTIEPLDLSGAISWNRDRFAGGFGASVMGIGLDVGFMYRNSQNFQFSFVVGLGSGIQLWAPPPILVTSIGGAISFRNGVPTIRLLGEIGVGIVGVDNLLALNFTNPNDPEIGLFFTGSLDGPVIGGGTTLTFQIPGLDAMGLGKAVAQLNLGRPSFSANLDASVRMSVLSIHGNFGALITRDAFGVTAITDANFVLGSSHGGWTLGRNIRHNSSSGVAGFNQYANNVNGFVTNLSSSGDIDIIVAEASTSLETAFWLDVARMSVGAGMRAHMSAGIDLAIVTVGVEGSVSLSGSVSRRDGISIRGSGSLTGEACIRYPCFSDGICKECWSKTVGVDISYVNGDLDADGYIR